MHEEHSGSKRLFPEPMVPAATSTAFARSGSDDGNMYAINKDTGAQERGCLADVGFANRRSDFLDNGFVFENMEGQVCVPAGA